MTLTQLEYIVAVANKKNFHRAAESCFVTQPTLSKLIKNIEEEFNVIIFDRTKTPSAPTRLGQVIIDQAKVVLLEAKRIEELVSKQRGEVKGELHVGIIPTIAPYLIPLFLSQFREKYSNVELSISELTTENGLKALDDEEIDLAILATEEDSKKYFQDYLYDEKMYLFLNDQHKFLKTKKVSVDKLKAEEMWLLEEGHCLRDEIIEICQLRKVEKKRPHGLDLKMGSLESLRYLVQDNFGYTMLPALAALRVPEQKLLREFHGPEPKRKIYFTTRRKHLRAALIAALRGEVLNAVKGRL